MLRYRMIQVAPGVSIRNLHEPEADLYDGWPASACIDEVERLRQEYIRWKYPDAEPRLQRTVVVFQRKAR
jgi:hypothetical protein